MTEPARTNRAATETLIGAVLFSAVWALVLTVVLQAFNDPDVKVVVGLMMYLRTVVFLISAGVLWLVVLTLLALTGRLWVTCALTLVAVVVVGAVDHTKLTLRQEPVYPSDADFLREPKFLVQMVGWPHLLLSVLGLVLLGALVVWLGRVPSRTFRPIRRAAMPRLWWSLVVARASVIVVCALLLGYAGHFNAKDNRLRAAYESAGVQWQWFNQASNYKVNTVVAGVLYNMHTPVMKRPAGYSAATMADITRRYQQLASTMNRSRSGSVDDVNVIVVLSEAFSDPTAVKGVHVEGDPIPRTRALMRRTTSGTMLAQMFGGGTANMEFEALTGQSMALFYPQMNTPYQQFVPKLKSYPTIVGYLKRHGHDVIAVHPYLTSMYRRSQVYRTFGFQKFIHDTTMHEQRTIDHSHFISDASAFDEVERQVQQHRKPLFVNLVTMQNHYPMAALYDDPWPVSGTGGGALHAELSGYARGIQHTDDALARFLGDLQDSPEKTAVVFYGDHLPSFWPDRIYRQNGDPAMRSTPFFVWTNFAQHKLPTAPLTSPTQFMPTLFDQVNAPLPPYYALLTRLREQVPAMEQDQRYGSDGQPIEQLSGSAQQTLRDYRLVQYDLSIGKRYSQEGLFYPAH